MSSEVIGLPCSEGDFGCCPADAVRTLLVHHLRDPDFALRESFTLRLPGEDNWYDARVGLQGDQVAALTVYRPDHSLRLWKMLLALSDGCDMLLVGSGLGEIGCIAANERIADAMPLDVKETLGPPTITRDPEIALGAICGT